MSTYLPALCWLRLFILFWHFSILKYFEIRFICGSDLNLLHKPWISSFGNFSRCLLILWVCSALRFENSIGWKLGKIQGFLRIQVKRARGILGQASSTWHLPEWATILCGLALYPKTKDWSYPWKVTEVPLVSKWDS